MSDVMTIESHKGAYDVHFDATVSTAINQFTPENTHFVVDARVANLYELELASVLASSSVLLIEATEHAKTLDVFPAYIDQLVSRGVRRSHVLVAIGGGVIQDITCFLAATLLRWIDWWFIPTTLLAQADSCIGSKSSINAGAAKNILGTFTPPRRVFIATSFLETLDMRDLRSGVGEILKVHAIDGPTSFDNLSADYDFLFTDVGSMRRYLRRALEIKKKYIEKDEFDRGIRNIFNYGHSFGHAIEAATDFAIPHGIAVTMGMDMANYVASRVWEGSEATFNRMHPTLNRNYRGFESQEVPLDHFLNALSKDKKNSNSNFTLILPDASSVMQKVVCDNDQRFHKVCADYFSEVRDA